jgi:HPr kinase/phosphorylase
VLKKSLLVEKFFSDNRNTLKIKLMNPNSGFDRTIETPELHRPGLALAGYLDLFTYDRIQILGNTEIRYLQSLSPEQKRQALEKVLEYEIPCLIVTENNKIPPELLSISTRRQICVFLTEFSTTKFSHMLSDYLNHIFAPQTTIHGTLVDVYGCGVLFTGRSGIGKSEIALDLIERGHRLVADDVVTITKRGEEILMGEGRELAEHHLEIRGLGLIDTRNTFGIRAVRIHKRVEVEVQLVEFDPNTNYDRTGLDEHYTTILGVKVPLIILPINPGKNITVIVETVALNQLLKVFGHHAAKEFNKRVIEKIRKQERKHLFKLKMRDFLDKDFE